MKASVAATDTWTDPQGSQVPAGHVHAWLPSTNQTLCGLLMTSSGLDRFPDVDWEDVQPHTGRAADAVADVCPRCASIMGRRRDVKPWTRTNPGG